MGLKIEQWVIHYSKQQFYRAIIEAAKKHNSH